MRLHPILLAPLAAALAAALPAAASDDGPRSARGAVHTAPQKQADFTSFVTTEAAVPARSVRLTAPAEGAFAARVGKGNRKRVDIGFGREIDENLAEGSAKNLGWTVVGDQRVTRLRIASPGAAALRVAIRFPATDEPFELRVAGSLDEAKVLGPSRLGGIAGQDIWWTPLTEGESQVIEIVSSAKHEAPEITTLRVSHMVGGPSTRFKTLSEIGASDSCNIDVACVASPSAALLSAARSVVQMLFTTTSGSSGLCTGTVLNDTLSSNAGYLYSGNHCFDSDDPTGPFNNLTQMTNVAGSLNTFFFFDAVACNSLAVPPGYVQRFGGADYLYNNVAQDVLFVRLRDSLPPNGVYLGWDANTLATGAAMTVLHHPRGDLKKFSTGAVQGVSILSSVYGPSGGHLNADTGYSRVVYNQGTTQGGSSGSGILTFNASSSEYQLRGGLWGGEASCSARTAPDYFSRLDVAFPALQRFLAPTGSAPALNATDLWYNPSESGWGLNLTQHASGQVFGVWYTYASTGRPLWLVMPGGEWSANGTVFTGQLYKVAGSSYAGTFNPNLVSVRTVGVMKITFSGNDNATFTYTVDGATGTKVITRQPF